MLASLYTADGEPVATLGLDGFAEIIVVGKRAFLAAEETHTAEECGYVETTVVVLDGMLMAN